MLIYDERVGCVAVYEAQDKWDCLELPVQNFVFYKAFKIGEDGKFQRDHNACDLARSIADGTKRPSAMTQALRLRLEAIAKDRHEGAVKAGRKVVFRVCHICGMAEWCASYEWTKFEVGLEYDALSGPEQCNRCQEAIRRNPEVCAWVIGVVSHARTMGPTVQG